MSGEVAALRRGYWLSVFGGLLFALLSFLEAVYVLYLSGFSFLEKVDLPPYVKMFLSTCIFFGLTAATLAFAGATSSGRVLLVWAVFQASALLCWRCLMLWCHLFTALRLTKFLL